MKEKKPQKKSWLYYYGIILLLLVVLNSVVFPAFYKMSGKVEEVDYGTFLTMVDEGKVNQVDIESSKQITFNTKEDKSKIYITGQVNDPELVDRLYKADVKFGQEIPQDDSPIVDFILYWILPTILMIAVFNFMMKKMGNRIGGRGNMMQFGKSNAKIYVEAQTGKTFADVFNDCNQKIAAFVQDAEKAWRDTYTPCLNELIEDTRSRQENQAEAQQEVKPE